jgi:hypothetical protein
MPPTYTSYVSRHTEDPSEMAQEELERLAHLSRSLRQAEANRDACATLHAQLNQVLQLDESCRVGNGTMTVVNGTGNPRSTHVAFQLEKDLLEDSRMSFLEAARSTVRASQEDCHDFAEALSELHQIQSVVVEALSELHQIQSNECITQALKSELEPIEKSRFDYGPASHCNRDFSKTSFL